MPSFSWETLMINSPYASQDRPLLHPTHCQPWRMRTPSLLCNVRMILCADRSVAVARKDRPRVVTSLAFKIKNSIGHLHTQALERNKGDVQCNGCIKRLWKRIGLVSHCRDDMRILK